MVRRDHIIRTKTRFGRCDTLAARRLHNICIPSDSFAEGAAGGGVTNRGDTATQSVRGGEKKKKSNLQRAPEVRLTDQVQTSIR